MFVAKFKNEAPNWFLIITTYPYKPPNMKGADLFAFLFQLINTTATVTGIHTNESIMWRKNDSDGIANCKTPRSRYMGRYAYRNSRVANSMFSLEAKPLIVYYKFVGIPPLF